MDGVQPLLEHLAAREQFPVVCQAVNANLVATVPQPLDHLRVNSIAPRHQIPTRPQTEVFLDTRNCLDGVEARLQLNIVREHQSKLSALRPEFEDWEVAPGSDCCPLEPLAGEIPTARLDRPGGERYSATSPGVSFTRPNLNRPRQQGLEPIVGTGQRSPARCSCIRIFLVKMAVEFPFQFGRALYIAVHAPEFV